LRAKDFLPGAGEAAELGDFHEGDELVKVHGALNYNGRRVKAFRFYGSKSKAFDGRGGGALIGDRRELARGRGEQQTRSMKSSRLRLRSLAVLIR
jgi:hypothetical protein